MKILVLYAKSGFLGHEVVAQNYAALLKKEGHEVQLGDIFAIEGKFPVPSGSAIYFWVITHASWIWRLLYFYWTSVPGAQWFKNSILPRRYNKTQKLILDTKPDLIVSTHPVSSGVVNYLIEKKLYKNKFFVTFSDYHIQPFWVYKNVDVFFIQTEEQKTYLLEHGFKEGQIVMTGILVAERYYHNASKDEARKLLGLDPEENVITTMGGGRAWQIENTLQSLAKLTTPTKVFVITGSVERQKEVQAKILDTENVKFTILPFMDPAHYFAASDLLISKPGGLTTSDAMMSKLPILAVNPLP
ncbi:MAG TPA: hypothetical protein VEA37_02900, partial [Flavobacterium sp.]|nr:hypothetical protein [Flavobacterium sp.]